MAEINTYEKELQRQQQLQQQQQQQQMIQQQKAQQQQMMQQNKASQQAANQAMAQKQQAAQQAQPAAKAASNAGNEQANPAAASPTVEAAQQSLQTLQNSKPQGYESKYGPQIDALIQQIQQPKEFKWDFNGDELFKSYADLYTQNGRQASMDAMGQAAALTGGYGNSYAQQVGNQAYDEYLRALYDKGLEFRDRAYEEWLNEKQDKYNQLSMLQNADQQDYGRYRDEVGDWQTDRAFEENVRQFNESLDWDKMSTQQKYAAEWAMQILANGQMPSEEMLKAAGLSAADAQKMMAQIVAGGGTGGRSGALVTKGAFNNYYETNPDGSLKTDKNGKLIPYDTSKGNYQVLENPTNDVIGATTVAGTVSKVGNMFDDLWKKLIKK